MAREAFAGAQNRLVQPACLSTCGDETVLKWLLGGIQPSVRGQTGDGAPMPGCQDGEKLLFLKGLLELPVLCEILFNEQSRPEEPMSSHPPSRVVSLGPLLPSAAQILCPHRAQAKAVLFGSVAWPADSSPLFPPQGRFCGLLRVPGTGLSL